VWRHKDQHCTCMQCETAESIHVCPSCTLVGLILILIRLQYIRIVSARALSTGGATVARY
jgi:hypothetical protein